MEKSLRIMATAGLLLCGFSAAQAQIKVVVLAQDESTSLSTPLTDVKRIEVSGSTLNFIGQSAGSLGQFSMSDVKKMVFTGGTQGIGPVVSDKDELKLTISGNILTVSGPEAALRGDVALYATDGRLLFQKKGWKGETLDVSDLPAGIYLLKVNTTTFKFRKS